MAITIKDITIVPGQDFETLEIELQNVFGDNIILDGYTFSARVWRGMDSLPLSANHDFDAETLYMKGALINNEPEVIEYEIFEGD